jgi:hypothetical protein
MARERASPKCTTGAARSQKGSRVSHILSTILQQSDAPLFLKHGVLGALCAWANDDGTFQHPPTVYSFITHTFPHRTRRYPTGRRLHGRAVRYQLRLCERLGILPAPVHRGGAGRMRRYPHLHPDAIARVTRAAVEAAGYAKGATAGRKNYATATKLCNGDKLCNEVCNGDISTVQPRRLILKRSLKNRKERPAAAADAFSRFQTHAALTATTRDYYTWFKPLALVADRGTVLAVKVANPGIARFIQKHHAAVLAAAEKAAGVQIAFVS